MRGIMIGLVELASLGAFSAAVAVWTYALR